MSNYVYKRYYIACGSKYFSGTYTYQGCLYAIWGDKYSAKEYHRIDSVNKMKERLQSKYIFGDHEDKDINIITLEKKFY